MLRLCVPSFLILSALLASCAQTPSDEGWTPLFDGQSLKGWTQLGGDATYEVRDGAIVGINGPGHNTFLTTENEYADFELEFEVQLLDPLNSGVQIRSKVRDEELDGETIQRVYGPQVEIERGVAEAGYIYGERAGGWLTPEEKRIPHDAFKDDEWNQYRIIAEGPRIQTWINGRQVSDLTPEEIYENHKSGFIGLQVHSSKRPTGTLEVAWRNIRIREL